MRAFLAFLLAYTIFIVAACTPPRGRPDAIPPDQVEQVCDKACGTFARFGCPEAELPKTIGCREFCYRREQDSIYVPRAACFASADSLEQLRACGTRCRQ